MNMVMQFMTIQDILSHVDHTLLKPSATWEEIQQICDDAIHYHTASVCIPPAYVGKVKAYVGDRIPVCTVIGFPNGYNTTAVKAFETADAVKNGASEIDMVINIGWVKDRKWDALRDEIDAVKESCNGRLLKVIVETCELSQDEKVKITEIVDQSSADYIKTSTGFSTGGATFDDVKLFASVIQNGTKIKAAGGIHSIADAEKFLNLGASRLGTSRIVSLVKKGETQ